MFDFLKRKQGIPSLPGNLWLDQPDAADAIEKKLKSGKIDETQAGRLRHWIDQGFLTFPVPAEETVYEQIDRDVDRFWKEKPADLPYAFEGQLRPFTFADESKERRSPYRIMDIHSHSDAASSIFLHPAIFDHVELIFGEPAVAIQSIYFEFGSQQGHHRDPVFVEASPPSHLVAAWIPLEDVSADAGALSYFPRSHRLPYFEFERGRFRFDPAKDTESRIWEMDEFNRQLVKQHGLEELLFTPKRGEGSIWHASLLHGGSKIRDLSKTRKSMVVHFSTLRNYRRHGLTVMQRETLPGGEVKDTLQAFWTQRLVTKNGVQGFDNPLRAAMR